MLYQSISIGEAANISRRDSLPTSQLQYHPINESEEFKNKNGEGYQGESSFFNSMLEGEEDEDEISLPRSPIVLTDN